MLDCGAHREAGSQRYTLHCCTCVVAVVVVVVVVALVDALALADALIAVFASARRIAPHASRRARRANAAIIVVDV